MTAAVSTATWPPHQGGRTHQPVRRSSFPFEAGERFFRPLKKAVVVQIMRAAERLAVHSMRARARAKAKRRHAGELTLADLAVLEAMLFKFMDWRSGRCAPTYRDLQEVTGLARDTIAAAIVRLSGVGILERMRRFRVAEREGKGPQVEQAPNAYRFDLPSRLRALLGLGGESRPLPDDVVQAAAEQRQTFVEHALQEAEQTGKSTLAAQLGRLGRAVLQRESKD